MDDITISLCEIISKHKNPIKIIKTYQHFDRLFFKKHQELYNELTRDIYNIKFIKTFQRYLSRYHNEILYKQPASPL